jgi:8-oxo-dGTP pyrophosphatase MutT (NUDIX family)
LNKTKKNVLKNSPVPFEKRKAGVLVLCQDQILLTQSYNNFWGIPKGQIEPFDQSIKQCAERELREETGLVVDLEEKDLHSVLMGNCYIYKLCLPDKVDTFELEGLDSTGIGWINLKCASSLHLNVLTKKLLTTLPFSN